METAAAYAGITKNTLYRWLKEGRRELERREEGIPPDPELDIYVEFVEAMEQAQAEAELHDVQIIQAAAEQQWQAAAWHLERKYPDRWGRKVAVDAKQEITIPQVQFIYSSDVKEENE